uniref:Uncharacterized protein n=1 Tax=Romanomermis culicivorax TaxID=13658 RepID=A0A915HUS6_ROMCU
MADAAAKKVVKNHVTDFRQGRFVDILIGGHRRRRRRRKGRGLEKCLQLVQSCTDEQVPPIGFEIDHG